MPTEIERKPRPRRTAMPYSPQHCQAARLVEPITGINDLCPARLCFLSQELYGFQCLYSPITPFFSPALFLDLHLQSCLKYILHLHLRFLHLHRRPFLSRLLILVLFLSVSLRLLRPPSLPRPI